MAQNEVNPLDFLILVVDDSKQNVLLLSHVLQSEGFRVEKSYDGDEALKKIEEVVPDLILLDIMMPKMSGLEVGNALRMSEHKDIPIIFLSSSNESVDKVKAFEAGGLDFVNKPFDKDELISRVRNHLMLKVLKEETEEQLKILKEREIELSEANQKKHKLMRMLSHDFKNPLSGIMGLITILLEDDSLEEDERTEMLELIKSGSEKLLELVKDLLDKEIVGSDFGTLNLEETDIVAFANEVVQNNRAKAALKKIKMNFMSDWDELMLNIDRDKMYYALNTLISNAVKFTISEGQVSVQLTRSKQGSLIVKVKDNGIGIPNSMLPNFLISSHKDQAKNPKGILGIGLGLEEVQSYVDAHEGIIWVESEENKGTTFFIELQLGN
jgi:two-component system sensor histidine kinase/response regulator|tara:strand:+ start:878 stop:2026 length:1149 start_codon:yes stop_codon:yes gene_type:complete